MFQNLKFNTFKISNKDLRFSYLQTYHVYEMCWVCSCTFLNISAINKGAKVHELVEIRKFHKCHELAGNIVGKHFQTLIRHFKNKPLFNHRMPLIRQDIQHKSRIFAPHTRKGTLTQTGYGTTPVGCRGWNRYF